MPEFKVRFQPSADLTVRVEAEDCEAAIELAYEHHGLGLCASCSGWREKWSLDVVLEDMEPYEVEDENGNIAWSDEKQGGAA